MWPFSKSEKRNAETTVTITTEEQDSKAIGLIFGQSIVNNYSMNLSAVFRAVKLISDSLASLPIVVYKKEKNGTKAEAVAHPLFNLLGRKPNPLQTHFEFIKAMTKDMLLHGNAYAIIHRDSLNRVTSLEYVSAKDVSLLKRVGADNEIQSVGYNISGRRRVYEDYEMIHILNEIDDDGVTGISTLTYAARTLGLATYGEKAAENYFKTGGKLAGLIKVNTNLTDKQKSDIRNAWGEAFSGDNANGIAVLSGAQDYTPIQQNAADAQLLESRKFSIDEIARFFGISPILLYDMEKNTYNSAEAAHLSLLTDTLQPIITKFEAEFETKLFLTTEINKYSINFDVEEFLRTDNKSKAEYYRTLFAMGVLSINEIRAYLDLNEIEDGDLHYVQAQLVTLENSKNTAMSTATAVEKKGEDGGSDDDKYQDNKQDSSINEE